MNRTEQIIYDLFKPYFTKHPELQSLEFAIIKDAVGKLMVSDVQYSVTVNGMPEQNWEDQEVVERLGRIESAISLLRGFEKRENPPFISDCVEYLESKYGGLFGSLRNTDLLKIVDTVYYPSVRMLTLLIENNASDFDSIPVGNWGFLNHLVMVVNKDECFCKNAYMPNDPKVAVDGNFARILTDAEHNEYLKSAGMRTRP